MSGSSRSDSNSQKSLTGSALRNTCQILSCRSPRSLRHFGAFFFEGCACSCASLDGLVRVQPQALRWGAQTQRLHQREFCLKPHGCAKCFSQHLLESPFCSMMQLGSALKSCCLKRHFLAIKNALLILFHSDKRQCGHQVITTINRWTFGGFYT